MAREADKYQRLFEEERRLREEAEQRLHTVQQHLHEEKTAGKRTRQALEALESRVNPTTLDDYLRSCHDLFAVPLSIQPNKSKSTKGSITKPTGRYCPTNLRKWDDFLDTLDEVFGRVSRLFYPPGKLAIGAFPSVEGLKTFGNVVSRRPLASELDLMSYERFAVETQVSLKAGLEPKNFWEDVVQNFEIPVPDPEMGEKGKEEKILHNARQLTGAAITQTFDYMIKEGLEYGYLTTGDAFVFLRIKEEDPTTLYWHLTNPEQDAAAWCNGSFAHSRTAISLVLSFCLMAVSSQRRSQEWRSNAFSALRTWAVDVEYVLSKIPEEERRRTPSVSSYIPSSPLSSPSPNPDPNNQPRRSRRLQGSCADSDDLPNRPPSDDSEEEEEPGNHHEPNPTGKRFAVVMSPPRPPPSKRQRSPDREPNRRYCTQRCLVGLANKSALDLACPNIMVHQQMSHDGKHPISKERVATLLDAQLNKDRDNGCWELRRGGARGILFKMTLADYGYTFVGKGTIEKMIPHLQHEFQVYEYLSKLQGNLIPVCLGRVNLQKPFITDGLDYIVHYLLLSWAGESQDDMLPYDLCLERRKFQKELHRYGVTHGDLRESNITWNEELSHTMLIDFDRARLDRKRPLIGSGSRGVKSGKRRQVSSPSG
ncbi:uncharacterized protein GIQ15_03394 [Arthroderma uncinatum]|uniref:uncharacterized protein n=1 Tax=Arthroderma uncinatum TaxID=74035 RepID=UPI00144AB1FA|nr:uncharacterized protein GIQ15_03394 [Arthroderma uncinatum]KAF3484070.1 hypothetical protein GIQ15_03394 [Arthroderma uncinatum]